MLYLAYCFNHFELILKLGMKVAVFRVFSGVVLFICGCDFGAAALFKSVAMKFFFIFDMY